MQDILIALRIILEIVTAIGVMFAAWSSRKAQVETRKVRHDLKATPSKVIDELRNGGQTIFPCYKPPDERQSS